MICLGLPLTAQSQDEQYLAGNAYLIKGAYGRAVESLSLAISRNNSEAQLFIRRGMALLNMNETTRAIEDFNEANLINPKVADLLLARAYAAEGDGNKAMDYLRSHLGSSFRVPEDSIRKDPAFRKFHEFDIWEAIWQKNWYTGSEKAIADAAYFIKKKQVDDAVSRLDQAIQSDPGNRDLLMYRGKAFMHQGNYAAAAGDFSSVLSKDKTAIPAYAERGIAYLRSERYKDAVTDLTKALRADPADFRLYKMRAEAYAGQENWQAAVKDMQLYMKYFNEDMQAVYQCGELYYAGSDYINALKCFNRNLTEDPNNAKYFKARGKTYLQTNTNRYAVNDLSMSLDLEPGDSETWMYHGLAAIKTGDTQNGCSSLRRAQTMGNADAARVVLDLCQ